MLQESYFKAIIALPIQWDYDWKLDEIMVLTLKDNDGTQKSDMMGHTELTRQ